MRRERNNGMRLFSGISGFHRIQIQRNIIVFSLTINILHIVTMNLLYTNQSPFRNYNTSSTLITTAQHTQSGGIFFGIFTLAGLIDFQSSVGKFCSLSVDHLPNILGWWISDTTDFRKTALLTRIKYSNSRFPTLIRVTMSQTNPLLQQHLAV